MRKINWTDQGTEVISKGFFDNVNEETSAKTALKATQKSPKSDKKTITFKGSNGRGAKESW
jgi:hypothetical protein